MYIFLLLQNEYDISVSETQNTEVSVIDGHRSREERSGTVIAPTKNTGKKKCFISPSDGEEEAYRILKSTCQRDDCSTYGEHVGNELRNLNPTARTIAKHMINNILFDASMGKYDAKPSTTSTPLGSYGNNYSEPPSEASACSHQSTFSEPNNSYVQPADNFGNDKQREDLSPFAVLSEFLVSKP